MLPTNFNQYTFDSKIPFTINDLENPEAIDEYMEAYTEIYNMCDRLNCHTIPTPADMRTNIINKLNSGSEPSIFISLEMRDFPNFSKKFTQDCSANVVFQLHVANFEKVLYNGNGSGIGMLPPSIQAHINSFAKQMGINPQTFNSNAMWMVIGNTFGQGSTVQMNKPKLTLECRMPNINNSNLASSMCGIVSTANVRLPLCNCWGEDVKEFKGTFDLNIFKEKLKEYENELVREIDMDKDLKFAVDDTKKNGKVYKDRMKEIKNLLATEQDKNKIKELKKENKECRANYENLLAKHLDVIQRKYDLKKDFE